MSQIELTLTAEHYEEIQQQAREYYAQDCIENPLTLTFELPSPWNYDISKAPRGKGPINIEAFSDVCAVYPVDDRGEYLWEDNRSHVFKNSEITAWMEIPALPERI